MSVDIMNILNTTSGVLVALVLVALPLIIVAYAGMTSERSGIINLGLEGMMVLGAFTGFAMLKIFDQSGFGASQPLLATLVAALVSMVAGFIVSLLLSFAAIKLKANQVIIGTAINIMAPALLILIAWALWGNGGEKIATPSWILLFHDNLMDAAALPATPSTMDYIGYFFNRLFFSNFIITTPLIILIAIALAIFLYRTKTGLRLRACGENPQAADSVGINVYRMRFLGTSLSGALAGIGGFAICLYIGFNGTVVGFGFLALAVMIFGNWKPVPIVFAGIVFALFRVIAVMPGILPDIVINGKPLSNGNQIYYCIPYLVTLIILIFASKRSRAPKAEGIPYDKGAR